MEDKFLKDYTENERTAFVGTIASLAMADNVATTEEVDIVSKLADEAGITGANKNKILDAAKGYSDDNFNTWLETLKNSELRFSLATELISFARSDGQYNEQEKRKIEEISTRLGINGGQFSLLNDFVNKSDENSMQTGEPVKKNFLESSGLGSIMEKAGISKSGLTKGLIAIAAPLLLSKLVGSRKGNLMGGKGLTSLLGAAGLSSLLGMLNSGRGFSKTGGLLSKLTQKKY